MPALVFLHFHLLALFGAAKFQILPPLVMLFEHALLFRLDDVFALCELYLFMSPPCLIQFLFLDNL